jgi:hypothetical protein
MDPVQYLLLASRPDTGLEEFIVLNSAFGTVRAVLLPVDNLQSPHAFGQFLSPIGGICDLCMLFGAAGFLLWAPRHLMTWQMQRELAGEMGSVGPENDFSLKLLLFCDNGR